MSPQRSGKVVPYVIPGQILKDEVNEVKLEIRNSRQEETFRKFQDPNAPQRLLCDLASEDDLLRLLFFIKPYISYQPVEEFPLLLEFPMFLGFDEKFLGFMFEESTKKKINEIREKLEEVNKSIKEISTKMMWRFFTAAMRDKQLSSKIQRRRASVKEEEIDTLISGVVERQRSQFESLMRDWLGVFGSIYNAQEYYLPMINAYDRLITAKESLEMLLNSLSTQDMPGTLCNSLSKLIAKRIFRLKITSLCMECNMRKGVEPYIMIQKYPLEPLLDVNCKKCGGRSIYHSIAMEAPHSLGPLINENTLQEFIVGYSLEKSEAIKKLYIHKKINIMREQGLASGLQMNILAITTNDKLLVIEVTTSKSLNKVMADVDKKLEALKDFPYDRLIFITPVVDMKDYLDYRKVRIFGARHLQKIVSHIGYLVEGK
jgi:hypothetical protein